MIKIQKYKSREQLVGVTIRKETRSMSRMLEVARKGGERRRRWRRGTAQPPNPSPTPRIIGT